jgi:putative FmdB family regulatory protein
MPVYEYKCAGCGKKFELIQKFSDEPLTTCPSCGGPVSKLISNTSFVLKGSGWYLTDYARAGRDKPSDSGKAPSGDGGGNGSGKKSETGNKSEKKSEEAPKAQKG